MYPRTLHGGTQGFKNRGEEEYVTFGAVYLVDIDPSTHSLAALRLVPFYMDKLSLKVLSVPGRPREAPLSNYKIAPWIWRRFYRKVVGQTPELLRWIAEVKSWSFAEKSAESHHRGPSNRISRK